MSTCSYMIAGWVSDGDREGSRKECLAYLLTGILPLVLVRNASFIQLENKRNTASERPPAPAPAHEEL